MPKPNLPPIEEILNLLSNIWGRDGCACINDMPGDNYTCTSHEKLYKLAREWEKYKNDQAS